MALIRVINNHTGDEGWVDKTWLERWPEDFTPADGDQVAVTEDPAPESPAAEEPPSDGTTKEIN